MKRITTFILAVFLCIAFSVVSFADDIYIVDDEEPDFVPDVQVTTTAPAETTTAQQSSGDSLFGDMGSFEDYLGGFKDFIGDGIDSILGGFDGFDFNFGETTTSNNQTPPAIDNSDRPTHSNQSGQLSQNTVPAPTDKNNANGNTAAVPEENTTQKSEVHSVLIVNGEKNKDDTLSGSTLTLLVFIAAIVLLILVAAIVLVVLTKRTEHNSAVMDKSTIPSIAKPRAMSQLMNDNIGDDGNDYGNIAYWND